MTTLRAATHAQPPKPRAPDSCHQRRHVIKHDLPDVVLPAHIGSPRAVLMRRGMRHLSSSVKFPRKEIIEAIDTFTRTASVAGFGLQAMKRGSTRQTICARSASRSSRAAFSGISGSADVAGRDTGLNPCCCAPSSHTRGQTRRPATWGYRRRVANRPGRADAGCFRPHRARARPL